MAKILIRKGTEISSNLTENLEAGNQKIINVQDPTNAQDVATKNYVDSQSASNALDGTFRIRNTADQTKELAFDVSGVATATTRTIIMPNANVDLSLIATAIQSSEKGAANGVATLNASGKLASGQIPAIAITETTVVADIAARDALPIGAADGQIQEGDVVVVTDASADVSVTSGGASYIYDGAAYQRLLTPDSAVQSVNGQTGVVSLDSDDIAEGSTNLYYSEARFDTSLSSKDTDDLSEGAGNLYYTQARFDSAFTAKSTTDLSEGTNLYYTQARFDTAFGAKSTDDLSEGATNKYYSSTLFDADLATKSTTDLSEGTNLYFTDTRAKTAAVSDEAYNATSWDGVTDVAPSKNAVRDELETKADASDVATNSADIATLQSDSGKVFDDAGVAGEALEVNEIHLVRRAKSGEVAGRYYKAQADSSINASVVGVVIVGGSAVTAGDTIRVIKLGEATLGSADTDFAAADLAKRVYLSQTDAGKFTVAPTTAAGDFIKEVGFVAETGILELQPGLLIEA